MKLCRLDLIAFGPFDKTSLDLSAGNPGLHVIYGDNEDGKSTTLRATRGLLFGIQGRTTDDHVFKKAQLRIGGRLRRTDGDELSFVRRKGNKDTLRHPDGDAPLPENALEPFPGRHQRTALLEFVRHRPCRAGGRWPGHPRPDRRPGQSTLLRGHRHRVAQEDARRARAARGRAVSATGIHEPHLRRTGRVRDPGQGSQGGDAAEFDLDQAPAGARRGEALAGGAGRTSG